MNLFDLQARISVAIQDAINNLETLGNHVSQLADEIQQGIGGNNEANISTHQAQENVEDLTDELEDQEEEVEDLADEHSKLGSILGSVGKGMLAVGGAVVGLTTGFLAIAESTREYREDMAKLESAFQTAGHTTEEATETYKELYSVFGESDRAVEAAQQISKLAKNEEEMAKMTNIATGAWAMWGDSLATESLMEAMNSTAKIGEVQGTLADALEWSGVNLEEFNGKLATMSTEEERSAYILDTLNGLYGEAADNYREVNKEVIAAQKAQAGLTEVWAEYGAIAEPILTTLKELATELLDTMLPFVELIGSGLQSALEGNVTGLLDFTNGINGLIETILEKAMDVIPKLVDVITLLIPTLVNTLLDLVPELLDAIIEIGVQIINMIGDLLPQLLIKLSEMLPELIVTILNSLPLILDALLNLVQGIVEALPTIITNLINALPKIIETIIDVILEAFPLLIDAAIKLFMALVEALPVIIEALTKNLPKVIDTIIKGVLEALPLLLEAAVELFMALIEAIPIIIQLLVIELPKIILSIQKTLLDNYPLILRTAFDLFMGIVKAIPQILGSLGKAMGDIATEIFDALGEIDLFELGKDIFQGLIDGMLSIGGDVWGAVEDLGNSIVDGFKDFFDIHSPSRLIKKEVGANVGIAVGEGALETLPEINKDMNELSGSVYDNLSNMEVPIVRQSGSITPYDYTVFDRLIDKLDDMEKSLLSMRIYLHDDTLVGELMPTINARLGELNEATERGR